MLEQLDAVDVESLAPEELGAGLKFMRATVDLLELQVARWLAAFDSRQAFYDLGEHCSVDWIRAHTHVSSASADSQVTLARQLETLEPTVEAVQQGDISFEHALLIARQVSDDGRGVTLNFGRARRCHSEPQREEISPRFLNCVTRGCTVPIRDCEIHHDVAWNVGGETDVQEGVPLCRRKHHPQVTEGGYRLERAADGAFDLVAPPGAEFRPDLWRRSSRRRGP